MRPLVLSPLLIGVVLAGCATIPSGPSVLVLPGGGKNFEQFQIDDHVCRQWAFQQIGVSPGDAATTSTVTGAAIGTVVGAAAGAAIGAAAGNPAMGAAAGAGAGLLGGTAIGGSRGDASSYEMQRRYDITYMQCMYAKGNQIPVSRGSAPAYTPSPPPPPPPSTPPGVPPPPAGSPPPPPR